MSRGTSARGSWHNRQRMEATLGPLLPLFERERRAGRALALGVLVHTRGSTYRKPGALILIAGDGDYAGLLSGGCLEGDLREHALEVIAGGRARVIEYDLTGPDDLLWGLGIGCEGAMRILLMRAGPDNGWQPLSLLAEALHARAAVAIGVVCDSSVSDLPVGSLALPGPAGIVPPAPLAQAEVRVTLERVARERRCAWVHGAEGAFDLFVLPLALPPRLLILGAGPDVAPVVELAAGLGWKVTLADHRAAYANPGHFPAAAAVVHTDPEALARAVELEDFSAAVIMSHHLNSDLAYLRVLAGTRLGYIGLLGPVARRDRLLADLGAEAAQLRARLRAPVGLPLGGRAPESIALAIIAEVHAFLHAPAAPAALADAPPARVAGS